MSFSYKNNPRLLLVGAFVILFMMITSFYLYKNVLKSADEIIQDSKNITRTAVKELTFQGNEEIWPVWEQYLKNRNKITKKDQRIVDSLLSITVKNVLSNYNRLEGGFYFYQLDEFLGYSFPTISDPKPAFGPPPRSYNIIRKQARETIQSDSSRTELHKFDPAIFPLSTQPLYKDGEIIGAAWARIHIERQLATSQNIQSGTFFLTVGAILFGLLLTVLAVWTLRMRIREMKSGISTMKYNPDHRLKEHNGTLGEISKAINEMTEARQKEQRKAKKLQAELYQKEKMASLGNLIAGTAHEINTPLSIIKTRIQIWERTLLKNRANGQDKSIITDSSMKIVHDEIERVSSLIKRLLFFSKPLKNEKTPLNIHALLHINIKRIQQVFPHQEFKVTTHFDEHVPLITADEEALNHVLLNVLKNAAEASPGLCRLHISTQYHPKEQKVELSVRDFGTGISEKLKKKMLEPFFSTKDTGTGLGLSICNEIVTAHNGNIEFLAPYKNDPLLDYWKQNMNIESIDYSQGTVVRITLPVS